MSSTLRGRGVSSLGRVVRGENLDGMRFKGDGLRRLNLTPRHVHNSVEERLVRQMNTIKVADGDHAGCARFSSS